MDNKQKAELRKLVRYDIPIEECNRSISDLWKEYGEEFTHGTFRNYFKIFNRLNGTTKLNNGNGIPPKPKVLGILPNFI